MHTPKKLLNKRILNGKVSDVVAKRWENCPGIPLQVINPETMRPVSVRCSCCPGKPVRRTSWYCVLCKGYFCVNVPPMETKSKSMKVYNLPFVDNNGKKLHTILMGSCFAMKHEDAWIRMNKELKELAEN